MPLPILQHGQSRDDLIRLFHNCDRQFAMGVCEAQTLGFGTALFSQALPAVYDAQRVVDAALDDDTPTPAAAVEEVTRFYGGIGLNCWKWIFNPASPSARVRPLAEHLVALGYEQQTYGILYLARARAAEPRGAPGLHILPARASFRHWRQIAEEAASQWPDGRDQIAQKAVDHLDDPHYDALVAIRDGQAVGRIGVLTVGELGLVEHVHVATAARRQGIATLLVTRALDICGRALHRHVMLRCGTDNGPALRLYEQFGFTQIGEFVEYQRPQ
jgi:GNAT superfamily N-acetyltransferase